MRRGALLLLVFVTGCGGGGGGSNDPGASAVVAARATLTTVSTPAIAVQWAPPLDISAQRIVEYQVFRSDTRVGAVDKNTLTFSDTTTEGSFAYHETSGTSLIARTGNHSAVRPGQSARYQVHVIFQRIEATGATTYDESVLNTPGVATTALSRPLVTQVTPQAAEALVRFTELEGADQYQVELSAFSDFHTKTVRGPVTTNSGFGLVTIPWPTDSTAGHVVYARVGARSTHDANPPLSTDPNGDDFIYSTAQTVTR